MLNLMKCIILKKCNELIHSNSLLFHQVNAAIIDSMSKLFLLLIGYLLQAEQLLCVWFNVHYKWSRCVCLCVTVGV